MNQPTTAGAKKPQAVVPPNGNTMMVKDLEPTLLVCMCVPLDHPAKEDCRWGASTLLWGSPGIGKSGRIEAVGAALGLPVCTVYLSTHQPEDISGAPFPDGKGGIKTFCTLPGVEDLIAHGKGILFLDELSTARPAVQGAGMSVVYNRTAAGRRLPGRVRVLSAANPADEAAGGWTLAPPMANRLLHFWIPTPSIEEWTTWLFGQTDNKLESLQMAEQIVTQGWRDSWARATGLISGFIQKRKALYGLPNAGNKDRGRSWPSPRTWEFAARCVATCIALDRPELQTELVAGCVGESLAMEWATWVRDADLPSAEQVLSGTWLPDRRRLDIAIAAYGSTTSFVLDNRNAEVKRADVIRLWRILTKAREAGLSDVALPSASALIQNGWGMQAGDDVKEASKTFVTYLGMTGLSKLAVGRRNP